jgi:GTP-binding protein HflX
MSDLMTENTKTLHTLEEWRSTWMSRVGEENALFISATNKENFEEFGTLVPRNGRTHSRHRFPYNKFLYPDYKTLWRKKAKEEETRQLHLK